MKTLVIYENEYDKCPMLESRKFVQKMLASNLEEVQDGLKLILVRPYNSKDFLLIYEIEAIRLIKSDITDHFFKRNNIRVLLTKE